MKVGIHRSFKLHSFEWLWQSSRQMNASKFVLVGEPRNVNLHDMHLIESWKNIDPLVKQFTGKLWCQQ